MDPLNDHARAKGLRDGVVCPKAPLPLILAVEAGKCDDGGPLHVEPGDLVDAVPVANRAPPLVVVLARAICHATCRGDGDTEGTTQGK